MQIGINKTYILCIFFYFVSDAESDVTSLYYKIEIVSISVVTLKYL